MGGKTSRLRITLVITAALIGSAAMAYLIGTGIGFHQEALEKDQVTPFYLVGLGLGLGAFVLVHRVHFRGKSRAQVKRALKRMWRESGFMVVPAFIIFVGAIALSFAGAVRFLNIHLPGTELAESHPARITRVWSGRVAANPRRPLDEICWFDLQLDYGEEGRRKSVLVEDALSLGSNALLEVEGPRPGEIVTYQVYRGALGVKWHQVERRGSDQRSPFDGRRLE